MTIEAMKLALEALECANSPNGDYENEIAALKERLAQPQPVAWEQFYTTPPQNFCPRCGKRTPDLISIHTCTPPQEGA